MERSLRMLAGDMQRTVAAIAARGPVPWSFRIARGALMSELCAAATPSDIVVTGALSLGLPRSLSVLCSVTTPPEAVVPAAAALARSIGRSVELVLLDGERGKQWERAAAKLLAAAGAGVRLRTVPVSPRQAVEKGGSSHGDR
jgi:hypothetical protein